MVDADQYGVQLKQMTSKGYDAQAQREAVIVAMKAMGAVQLVVPATV